MPLSSGGMLIICAESRARTVGGDFLKPGCVLSPREEDSPRDGGLVQAIAQHIVVDVGHHTHQQASPSRALRQLPTMDATRLLLLLVSRGGGGWSLDHLFCLERPTGFVKTSEA